MSRSSTKRLSPATDRDVERLTHPHTLAVEGQATDWPPLIDWIRGAVTEQVARGGTGSGDGRSPINEGALAIVRRIERGVMHLRGWLYLAPRAADTKADLAEAWKVAHDYRAKGELDDEAWERIIDRFGQWVADIEAEWEDRPSRMELVVPCPKCGARYILDTPDEDDGPEVVKQRAAVVIEYAEGRAPIAECRALDCGGHWVGWAAISELGSSVNVKPQLAVLAACGIELNLPDTP